MNLLKLLAASTVLSAVLAPMAHADGRLETILQRGHLIVGTGSTNAPWHYIDAEGKLVGFDVAIAKILAKGLFDDESKIEFVDQAADARIANLITDKVDITCQFMTVTAGRAQQVEFTIPYYREGIGFLLLSGGKYKNYDELKAAGSSLTIAFLQNSFAEEWAHKALPGVTVDQYESMDLSVQALNGGRADTAIMDVSNIRWLMKQEPNKYLDGGYYWQPNSYSCATKKGDQAWLNWLNTALHEAMTGVDFDDYATAYEKAFGVKLTPPPLGAPVEYR